MKRIALSVAVALLATTNANAAVSLTAAGYSNNFDMLASSGTNHQPPADILIAKEGAPPFSSQYQTCSGLCFGAEVYSFGAPGDSERALGSISFGGRFDNQQPQFGLAFTNNTGAALTSLTVSYAGEQWRAGSANRAAPDRLDFSYIVGADTLTASGFVDVDALDYQGGIFPTLGGLDGNANRTAISATITFAAPIAVGQSFTLRWTDVNEPVLTAFQEDGLAIDDLLITVPAVVAPSVPEPATWAMMLGGMSLVGGALRRRKTSVAFA